MEDWTQAIQNALEYVEEHLAGELEICEISRRAFLSPFYFQRIFSTLCGLGVGEYIRYRRLTLAAQELCSTVPMSLTLPQNTAITPQMVLAGHSSAFMESLPPPQKRLGLA